jgi:GMP reductase
MGEMKPYRTSEGSVSEVPYVGPVATVVADILGGLRSTGTYIGASSIKHFGKCATFVKTSKVHDKF